MVPEDIRRIPRNCLNLQIGYYIWWTDPRLEYSHFDPDSERKAIMKLTTWFPHYLTSKSFDKYFWSCVWPEMLNNHDGGPFFRWLGSRNPSCWTAFQTHGKRYVAFSDKEDFVSFGLTYL